MVYADERCLNHLLNKGTLSKLKTKSEIDKFSVPCPLAIYMAVYYYISQKSCLS